METPQPPAAKRRFGWSIAWMLLAVASLAASILASGAITTGRAEAERASQDDVEAAYLYNFGRFVRWPASDSHTPMLICIAARSSFGEAVARLVAGESINGRPLQERLLHAGEKPQGCSILFIGAVEQEHLEALLTEAGAEPILTVSDVPDFMARGGMIQFVMDEDHVRFSVNLDAAAHNKLDLSSELLKVAVRVVGGPAGQGAR